MWYPTRVMKQQEIFFSQKEEARIKVYIMDQCYQAIAKTKF
jgi:hypothetical protein